MKNYVSWILLLTILHLFHKHKSVKNRKSINHTINITLDSFAYLSVFLFPIFFPSSNACVFPSLIIIIIIFYYYRHLNKTHQLSLQALAQVEVCASRLELYLRTVSVFSFIHIRIIIIYDETFLCMCSIIFKEVINK